MSLVDYAASSEEEQEDLEEEDKKEEDELPVAPLHRRPSVSVSQAALPPPMLEKLPDASLLFASSSFSSHQTVGADHSSMVAAAMAVSESRKRTSNGSSLPNMRSKHPRGQLPRSRNVSDATGGLLIPPQLRGRSNVVTEDISKLFVKREGQNLRDGNQTT